VDMTDKADQWIWYKDRKNKTRRIKLKTLIARVNSISIKNKYFSTRKEANDSSRSNSTRSSNQK